MTYVCAEASGDFAKRLKAYSTHHGVNLLDLPFQVITDVPNLLKPQDVAALTEQINAAGGADIIVIDTLATVTPGSNENSSEDMGRAITNAQEVSRLTGAMVLLVHHLGKDETRGARGWSGLNAAVDVSMMVTRQEDARVVRINKLREGGDEAEFGFRLVVVPTGFDEDGDVIDSCVAVETEVVRRRKEPKGKLQKHIYREVERREFDGEEAPTAVMLEEIIIAAREAGGALNAKEKANTRVSVNRAIEALVLEGYLFKVDGCLATQSEGNSDGTGSARRSSFYLLQCCKLLQNSICSIAAKPVSCYKCCISL